MSFPRTRHRRGEETPGPCSVRLRFRGKSLFRIPPVVFLFLWIIVPGIIHGAGRTLSNSLEKPPALGAIRATAHPRTGGDGIADAEVIPSIPYVDLGQTCDFADDYDETCPYEGSSSADVVYVFEPENDLSVEIDLCASGYDTKVYVYDFGAGYGFGHPFGCNDDAACGYSGFQSSLRLTLSGGHTYHVVVDGYGGDCGDYLLSIEEIELQDLVCPAEALEEGEEDCGTDYEDDYNGGCNSSPPAFTPLSPTYAGAPFQICGTGGTYDFHGSYYRDTDWYELTVQEENTITFRCAAQFPVLAFIVDGNHGCDAPEILASSGAGEFPDVCELVHAFPPGNYWFWVGPAVYEGIECGSLYVLTISGYAQAGTPVSVMSWGSIKQRYR